MAIQGLDITGQVLLSYGLQAFICVLVAWLLADFSRRQPQHYLRWWSLSWVALFAYLVTAALALSSFGYLHLPANDWRRIVLSVGSLVAGLLQPLLMAIGSFECVRSQTVARATRRWLILGVTVAAVAIAIGSTWSDYRVLIRLGTRSLFAGAAFLSSAMILFRQRRHSASAGRNMLAWGALLYGIEQLHLTWVPIYQKVAGVDLVYPYYMGYLDVVLQTVMGFGMLTWHLESERARTESAMQALEESEIGLRQAQKMEVVGRLAGGIAHDFNNLMTVMYGATDMLAPCHPPGTEEHECVEDLVSSLDRARSLTSQLLSFSRKQVSRPARIDLGEALRANEKMLLRLVGTDIVVRTQIPAGVHSVIADPGQLTQILMNLAVNARDAMPHGGELTIALAEATVDEAAARRLHTPKGAYYSIAIQDTGVGMGPEVKEHLFEPFFTTKPNGRGTGLGLSTVYGIVRAAGGAIDVQSEPGRGTRCVVYWPHAPNGVAAEPSPSSDALPRPVEQTRVLVVEDDPPIRNMLRTVLEKQGYRVVTAGDGAEGLMALRTKGPFELMITDVVMPGMDGSELVAAARKDFPRVRILMTSGFTGELAERAIPADVAWLQKPFSTHKLLETLEALLHEGAAQRS